MPNYLHVSFMIQDGSNLHGLLRTLDMAGAGNVEIKPVVDLPELPEISEKLLKVGPTATPNKTNMARVRAAMVIGSPVSIGGILTACHTLTRKQIYMALFNLMAQHRVRRVRKGVYEAVS